jgi:hypothetical protein
MQMKTVVVSGALAAFLMSAGIGCEKKEGPAEQAGQKLDENMEKAKEKMHDAGDAMKGAGKQMKDAAEDAKP